MQQLWEKKLGALPFSALVPREGEQGVAAQKGVEDPGPVVGGKRGSSLPGWRWNSMVGSAVFMLLSFCFTLVYEAYVLGSPIPLA